jgi:hypothetical protein
VKKNKMSIHRSVKKTFHKKLLINTKIKVLTKGGTLGAAAASQSKIKLKNKPKIKLIIIFMVLESQLL